MEIKTVSNVQRQKERVVPSNAGLISSWIALSIFYPPSWEEKRKTFNLFFLRNLLFPFIWFNLGLRHSQSGVSLRFPGLGSHQIVKKIFFFHILFLFYRFIFFFFLIIAHYYSCWWMVISADDSPGPGMNAQVVPDRPWVDEGEGEEQQQLLECFFMTWTWKIRLTSPQRYRSYFSERESKLRARHLRLLIRLLLKQSSLLSQEYAYKAS